MLGIDEELSTPRLRSYLGRSARRQGHSATSFSTSDSPGPSVQLECRPMHANALLQVAATHSLATTAPICATSTAAVGIQLLHASPTAVTRGVKPLGWRLRHPGESQQSSSFSYHPCGRRGPRTIAVSIPRSCSNARTVDESQPVVAEQCVPLRP